MCSYSEALAWFVEALLLNDGLVTAESPQASKALDGVMLAHFHRECLKVSVICKKAL